MLGEGADLDVTIDLGEVMPLREVSLSCLEVQGSWIFLPKTVELSLSEDGRSFRASGRLEVDAAAKSAGEHRRSLSVPIPDGSARYLRLRAANLMRCPDWHLGAGGKTWLFVDEIVIN